MNTKYLTRTLPLTIIVSVLLVLGITNCAMMPRTMFDSSSEDIIESQIVTGKYKVYIYPLDKAAVAENSKDKYLYKIGAHDQLGVIVWGHPEFSSPSGLSPVAGERYAMVGNLNFKINEGLTQNKYANKSSFYEPQEDVYNLDEDGLIFVPLCGSISAVDKTPKQVKQEVTRRVSDYVVNPQVNVSIVSYRSKFTYVLGEVNQTNMIPINDVPLDLASALAMSGWVNLTSADVKNIYVLRQGAANSIKVYRLNATTPSALVFASEFILQPSDVTFVSTAGVAQFDRVMTHFLNTAEILWYTRTAINPTSNIIPGIN